MLTYISVLLGTFLTLFTAAKVTNPFSRISIVRKPFVVRLSEKTFVAINNNYRIVVNGNPLWRTFALLKCGVHVIESRYLSSPRSSGRTVESIIADIHKLRFDPDKLLLISGDHFSPLFVRNIGIFYYPMLDTRTPSSVPDWHDRQAVYLQTVAYALGVFAKHPKLTTTLVSTGAYRVTPINFYAYPSDSLYGMLYGLAAMLGKEKSRPYSYGSGGRPLDTTQAAQTLLAEYGDMLRGRYADYRAAVYSEADGLIRTDVHLSGAKDITRRTSALYDNVIFWKTTALAMELGLIDSDPSWLRKLKKRILKTYWLPAEGYFLEDLSDEGREKKYYSSDWLVVLLTGFLDPAKKTEYDYFRRSLAYIDEQKIDRPFALKYHTDRRAHRQFLAVRLAVASYGSSAIWSFWGMEYIKVLLAMYRISGDQQYLQKADYHITQYEHAMVRDGGFPEVFNSDGKLLQTPLYRSIRQTGWVIGFEQVRAIRVTLA